MSGERHPDGGPNSGTMAVPAGPASRALESLAMSPSPRRWVSIALGVQAVLACALGIASLWGADAGLGWLALAAIAGVLVSLRHHRWLYSLRCFVFRSRIARADVAPVTPEPFDIPEPADLSRTVVWGPATGLPDHPVGARWIDGILVTAIRITANRPRLLRLGANHPPQPYPSLGGHDPGEAAAYPDAIALSVFADSLTLYDIPLHSIDIISQTLRARGPERLARTYDELLGPLRWSADRTVIAVVRLDPTLCAAAVARRGGGSFGVLRAASVTTRRLARRLTEAGVAANALTSTQLSAATLDLSHGVGPAAMTERWHGSTSGRLHMHCAAVDIADRMSRVFGAGLADAVVDVEEFDSTAGGRDEALPTSYTGDLVLAVTTVLRLRRPTGAAIAVSAMARVDGVTPGALADDTRSPGPPPPRWAGLTHAPYLHPLVGRHREAVATMLPGARLGRAERLLTTVSTPATETFLRAARLPVSGNGILVGADRHGIAVSARLWGQDVATVAIVDDPVLLWQYAYRTAAVGILVSIHTTRPDRWQALVAGANTPHLAFAHGRPTSTGPYVEIIDVATPMPRPDEAGTAGPRTRWLVGSRLPESSDEVTKPPSVVITRDSMAPQSFHIRVADERATVKMVSTAAEQAAMRPARDNRGFSRARR